MLKKQNKMGAVAGSIRINYNYFLFCALTIGGRSSTREDPAIEYSMKRTVSCSWSELKGALNRWIVFDALSNSVFLSILARYF